MKPADREAKDREAREYVRRKIQQIADDFPPLDDEQCRNIRAIFAGTSAMSDWQPPDAQGSAAVSTARRPSRSFVRTDGRVLAPSIDPHSVLAALASTHGVEVSEVLPRMPPGVGSVTFVFADQADACIAAQAFMEKGTPALHVGQYVVVTFVLSPRA